MNKNKIIALATVIILIGVGALFFYNKNKADIGTVKQDKAADLKLNSQKMNKQGVEIEILKEGTGAIAKKGDTVWLMTILAKDRDNLADKLKKRGIETNLVHIRSDVYTLFKPYAKGKFPKMDALEGKYLCIPLHRKMRVKDIRFICDVIKKP